MFANDVVLSYAEELTRSVEDVICIAKLEGNQAMLFVILSALVTLIHTFQHL